MLVVGVANAAFGAHDAGVAWAVVGALLVIPFVRDRIATQEAERQDLADSAALRQELASGVRLVPVEPATRHACGRQLDLGEACLVDAVPVEVVSFYGDPAVIRQGVFVAWGSPLAWAATIFANLAFWQGRKNQERKAAARWRDPEAARLCVTTKRYFLSGLTEERSSIDIPWERISQFALEGDGIVIVLTDAPQRPIKVKSDNPAWHYALVQHLAHGAVRGSSPLTR
jgi:hypothetical protein